MLEPHAIADMHQASRRKDSWVRACGASEGRELQSIHPSLHASCCTPTSGSSCLDSLHFLTKVTKAENF